MHPQYGRQRFLSLTMPLPITLAPIAQSLGATVITSAAATRRVGLVKRGRVIREPSVPSAIICFFWTRTHSLSTEAWTVSLSRWLAERDPGLVLSLLPYHAMSATYEQLSLFFNVLMAAGAGGFGLVSEPRLFGQSLLISKETYFAVGGHAAVRGFVLENLNLAHLIRASGARILCLGGRGTLHMRMFPEGLGQMSDSWTKAFIHGAAVSDGFVLASAVVWISALWSTALLLIVPRDYGRLGLAVVYLLLSLQLVWLARQLGSYRFLTCLLYPLPLAYYCAVFGRSAARRALHRKTVWRGREV